MYSSPRHVSSSASVELFKTGRRMLCGYSMSRVVLRWLVEKHAKWKGGGGEPTSQRREQKERTGLTFAVSYALTRPGLAFGLLTALLASCPIPILSYPIHLTHTPVARTADRSMPVRVPDGCAMLWAVVSDASRLPLYFAVPPRLS